MSNNNSHRNNNANNNGYGNIPPPAPAPQRTPKQYNTMMRALRVAALERPEIIGSIKSRPTNVVANYYRGNYRSKPIQPLGLSTKELYPPANPNIQHAIRAQEGYYSNVLSFIDFGYSNITAENYEKIRKTLCDDKQTIHPKDFYKIILSLINSIVMRVPGLSFENLQSLLKCLRSDPKYVQAMTNSNGITLLHHLTSQSGLPLEQRIELARQLITMGADVNQKSEYESPLERAVAAGDVDYVRFLLENGASLEDQLEIVSALRFSIRDLNEWIRGFQNGDPEGERVISHYLTTLQAMLQTLVSHGLDINTPLVTMIPAGYGSPQKTLEQTITYLVKQMADSMPQFPVFMRIFTIFTSVGGRASSIEKEISPRAEGGVRRLRRRRRTLRKKAHRRATRTKRLK